MKTPFLFILAITILAPQAAKASTCHSDGWFGGGKVYLICSDGRKFGPYENGSQCVVKEAFENKCHDAGSIRGDEGLGGAQEDSEQGAD